MVRSLLETLSLSFSSRFSSLDLFSMVLRSRHFRMALTSLAEVLGKANEMNLGKREVTDNS